MTRVAFKAADRPRLDLEQLIALLQQLRDDKDVDIDGVAAVITLTNGQTVCFMPEFDALKTLGALEMLKSDVFARIQEDGD